MRQLRRFGILLLILVLCLAQNALAAGVVELSEAERLAMNQFLSVFTEVSIDTDGFSCYSDNSMAYFIYYYYWYNANNSFEFGEYEDGYNCRFPADDVPELLSRFFDISSEVDLSKLYSSYDGKYIYGSETGGNVNGGFALTLAAYETAPNKYFVSFIGFGSWNDWSSDDLELSFSDADEKYSGSSYSGCAWITATDLSDPSTYRMIRFIH